MSFSVEHEKKLKELNNQIRDLQNQKESALREVAELKVQLKMAEETRDTIRHDLIEANRKIREGMQFVIWFPKIPYLLYSSTCMPIMCSCQK